MSSKTLGARLGWYARRLSAMSPAEVAHRVAEMGKKRSARRRASGWSAFEVADGVLPVFPAPVNLDAADDGLIAGWERIATSIRARRHRFLGLDWPISSAPWHLDPVSGQDWPRHTYCFDINYRHSGTYGDVKYVWELNRLQYLQPIAALASLQDRDDLRKFVVSEIMNWMDNNPPFDGINWPSGIELSLRVISVLLATRLLGPDAFSALQRRKLRSLMAATGTWLYRYPSRFSSANNHLIAEAVGLLAISLACPDLPQANDWCTYARRVLAEEVDRQFHADGIGAEQSPTYSAFTLEFYALAARMAETTANPLSDMVLNKLAQAGSALSWFMDENGVALRIGDDDEGRVIYDDPDADRLYVASVLSAIAALSKRPDIAPPVSPPHLRNLVLGRMVSDLNREGLRSFREGGYTVLRDAVNGKQLLVCMDHGPLGFLSIAAHGHADTLAVWLTYGGRPLLADAGTYLYHSGGTWRDAFRGTMLHNTLSVGGESSSLTSGAFNWKVKAKGAGLKISENAVDFSCTAEHDGYASRFGLRHIRTLSRTGPDQFTLLDRLEGSTGKVEDISIGFLAGEGVDICATEDPSTFEFRVGGSPAMRLEGPGQLNAEIVRGDEEKRQGWLSPWFGTRISVAQLIFSGSVAPQLPFETRLRLL